MAGKRYSLPNLDDVDFTINNDNYVDSDYVAPDAKTSVKNTTDQQTDKMAATTPNENGKTEETSQVSGAIDEKPCDDQDKVIEENVKQSENDNLKYIADNNPEYLDEMGLSPDEILGINMSGDSGYTYEDANFITDENGLTYLENDTEFFSSGQNLSGSQIVGTGQPEIVKVSTQFSYPVKNFTVWGSPFGFRILPEKPWKWKFHGGVDVSVSKGTPVLAIFDCVITKTYPGNNYIGGYGNYIQLEFTFKGNTYIAFYAHLDSILVKKDDKPKKGQVIGYSGNSGSRTPIPYPYHLHFEIKDKNVNKIWTCPTGDVTRTVDQYGRSSMELGGSGGKGENKADSLVFLSDKNGLTTYFQPNKDYYSYIDPVKFYNYPDDSDKWKTTDRRY